MKPHELKTLREKLGLTQVELAERLAITRDAVASWETGRNPINTITRLAIEHLSCKLRRSRKAAA